MVDVTRSELINEIRLATRVQEGYLPKKLGDTIIPVINVTPKDVKTQDIFKHGSASNATSATLYTTPTDQDFYLTHAELAVIKDATSTSTESSILLTQDGVAKRVCYLPSITLTAQTLSQSSTFRPMLLSRGTTITITNSTNAANIKTTGCIIGFTMGAI